jgi:hypothetical protein
MSLSDIANTFQLGLNLAPEDAQEIGRQPHDVARLFLTQI